jgi:hypothetical protein
MLIAGRESSVLALCNCGNPLAILARDKLKIWTSSQSHGTCANPLVQDAPDRAIAKPHWKGRTARDDFGDGEVEKPGHARGFDASERRVECAPDGVRSA